MPQQYKVPVSIAKYATKAKKKTKKAVPQEAEIIKEDTVSTGSGNGDLKKAKIPTTATTQAVKQMGSTYKPEEAAVGGEHQDYKDKLAKLKKAYEVSKRKGNMKDAKRFAEGYNKLLRQAKKFTKKNIGTILKVKALQKKYSGKIKKAMDVDEKAEKLNKKYVD